ncbi:MAG: hypothetical protein HY805_06415 [Nitrospirae bacterium]|nr:hypothetical protein [Nitrospirota bacterium]
MFKLNAERIAGKGSIWMILLGPFFGVLFVCLIPFVSMLVAVVFLTRIASASVLSSDEAGMCMGCHSTPIVKTFKNGEKLSIVLSEKHFKDTVHSFLGCSDCHNDISMDNHPSAVYGSKREFSLHVTSACRNCHPDEQILKKPLHQHAVTRANAPPCSECHGSHSIRKSSGWKETASDSQYCLTCHKQDLKLSLNGEVVSLKIDETVIRKSVHSNHNCSDCHVGFSKKEHPLKKFEGRRQLSVEISSSVCRRCHPDKYAEFEGSIHFGMLKEGNLKAPVCTDCHGAHSVGPKAIAETMAGVPCRKCHEDTFEEFKGSVHGVAKAGGKAAAPICSSCHSAHGVKPATLSMSPKARCTVCHNNAEYMHDQWLPNAAIHLEAVACTACHVPNVGRRIYLSITDRDSGKVISEPKVKELLGADYGMLTDNPKGGIGGRQLWDIYQRLNDKETSVRLKGTVGIQDSIKSHCVTDKSKALRQCDTCHNAQSDSFKAVSLSVIKGNGKEGFVDVNPKALSSIFSVLPLNQFYALGSMRVKILDFLGIFMVLAGASFPAVHITMRILTRRLRASKKHKGHGR